MSNRDTDSGKWCDQWFRSLPPNMKLFFLYICDSCDHAGIWKIDLGLASFQIGSQITLEDIAKYFMDIPKPRIKRVKEEHLWVIKYCAFQYKNIAANNAPVVTSARKILQEFGLWGEALEAASGLPQKKPAPPTANHPARIPFPDPEEAPFESLPDPLPKPVKTTKPSPARTRLIDNPYSEDFLSFWEAYPNKKGKAKAWEYWQTALNKPSVESIIETVRAYEETTQWQKDGGQYIPHGSTFISKRLWEDAPEDEMDYEQRFMAEIPTYGPDDDIYGTKAAMAQDEDEAPFESAGEA